MAQPEGPTAPEQEHRLVGIACIVLVLAVMLVVAGAAIYFGRTAPV